MKHAKYSENETKNHVAGVNAARGRVGLSTMRQGSVTPSDTGSAKMAGNTRGLMFNGGNTPTNVKKPTGCVRDTMKQ